MVRCSLCHARGSARWLRHHGSLCSGLSPSKKKGVEARDKAVRSWYEKRLCAVIKLQKVIRGWNGRRSTWVEWLYRHKVAKKVQDAWRHFSKLKKEGKLDAVLSGRKTRSKLSSVIADEIALNEEKEQRKLEEEEEERELENLRARTCASLGI